MQLALCGIGIRAPGMPDWTSALPVLCGEQALEKDADLAACRPGLLPANERRRTTPLIRLALQAAEEATQSDRCDRSALATVFASSEGDAEIVDKLCTALTLPGYPVSPTHFHNSVHNAAAGYWSIAAAARRFSTSIAAGDVSFAMGLMEAAGVAALERQPVLLVAYDYPLPPALAGRGYVDRPFAVALLFELNASERLATLSFSLQTGAAEAAPLPEPLQPLREANPAAASLPLLRALARGEAARLTLPTRDESVLCVELAP